MPSPARPESLPMELSMAIRQSHLKLNRHITFRLPLCLPPCSPTPYLYVCGMTIFSQLYTAIEDAWDQLLQDPNTDERIRDILETLQTKGLRRSDTLRDDLSEVRCRLADQKAIRIQEIETLTQHYHQNLHKLLVGRPHLLLAWSWNMYLAIFNGGRYIRQALRDAGEQYWTGEPHLSFWEFDGDQNGENIKEAFKKKFEIVSQCLTRNERVEVVEEAKRVMTVCQEMVQTLDSWFDTPKDVGMPKKKLQAVAAKQMSVAPPEQGSLSVFVALMALLAGIWAALLRTSTSWKGAIRPALGAKDIHAD